MSNRSAVIAVLILMSCTNVYAQADGTKLERLQRADTEFFPEELFEFDMARRDSVLSEFERLGLDEFSDSVNNRGRLLRPDFGVAQQLWDYNRVEGFVAGVAAGVKLRGTLGLSLSGEAAYAVGSEEFRHRSRLNLPVVTPALEFQIGWADRVEAYGANQPRANWLRALVAGADERDYLRRRGGEAELVWSRDNQRLSVGYAARRETSVAASTSGALRGRLGDTNAAVDEGIDRAVFATLRFGEGPDARRYLRLRQSVSGGGLGGSFAYDRGELFASARQYVGRQELALQLEFIRTGGDVPRQQLADLGGIDSVAGFRRRTRVGKASLRGSAEWLLPYDLMRHSRLPYLRAAHIQFVPFAASGRVFDGVSDEWISTLGLGMQRFLGPFGPYSNLRLDFALPLGPERPSDLNVSLRFTSWLP